MPPGRPRGSAAPALPVPEDDVKHPQPEDAADDEQVVADQLQEAEGGADLGPPEVLSRIAATMPDAAARNASRNWWVRPVTTRRSRSSANSRTLRLSLPCSSAPVTRSNRRGSRRSTGSSAASSSAADLAAPLVTARGHVAGCVRSCFGGYVDPGRQQGQRAFQGGQGAQDGGDLGRGGQLKPGSQPEQVGEHLRVAAAARQVARHELAEGPLQLPVRRSRRGGDQLQQGVAERRGVAAASASSRGCSAERCSASRRPTEPKSSRARRPSVSSRILPGSVGVDTPPSVIWYTMLRSSARVSPARSSPRSSIRSKSKYSAATADRVAPSVPRRGQPPKVADLDVRGTTDRGSAALAVAAAETRAPVARSPATASDQEQSLHARPTPSRGRGSMLVSPDSIPEPRNVDDQDATEQIATISIHRDPSLATSSRSQIGPTIASVRTSIARRKRPDETRSTGLGAEGRRASPSSTC